MWESDGKRPGGRVYRYKLACVTDGGLLLELSHDGSFGIGIHSCGSGEDERESYVELIGILGFRGSSTAAKY